MTDDNPDFEQPDIETLEFPDDYLDKLKEYDDSHEGLYGVWTGGFYRAMTSEKEDRFSEKEAMQVVRLLQHSSVENAEDKVYEVLDNYE